MAVAANRLPALALVVGLCAAFFAVPADATTPISGNLNLIANATLATGPDYISSSESISEHTSWSGAPGNLGAWCWATAVAGGDSLTASISNASAAWSSADAGSVDFVNYGWNASISSPANGEVNLAFGRGGDDWAYTFTATGDGKITLTYNESLASGNGIYLWGWGVDFTGSGSGAPILNNSSPNQSGVFTGMLLSGHTYTIGLNSFPNRWFQNWTESFSGYMDGAFDWRIAYNSVPEPATWTMMLLGIGAIGAVMRTGRRREGMALAAA